MVGSFLLNSGLEKENLTNILIKKWKEANLCYLQWFESAAVT